MNFVFYEINGSKKMPLNIISYEITSEAGAACDGLRVSFYSNEAFGEISEVKAFDGGELIFNGFCDMQKMTLHGGGFKYFIYARSTASLLVDNEAAPLEYNKPSAAQLCFSNTSEFGFKYALPEIYSENRYIVAKGKSCFAAVNDFVYAMTASNIYITPENEIKILEKNKKVKKLCDFNISSVSYVINRSEPISCIDYKINSADDYVYHYKNALAERRGIKRKRLINLSAVPEWQGKRVAAKMLERTQAEYYCVEACVCGKCSLKLFDTVDVCLDDFSVSGRFIVYEITRLKNKNGEKTVVLLKKENESELINYVD